MLAACSASAALAATAPLDWTLQGTDGHTVHLGDLPPKFLFVYFGYAYCPDLCPTALGEIAVILEELHDLAEHVQPVFISIDPERDTPELLQRYVTNFDAPIIALTGSAAAIEAAARQVDFHFVRYQDPSLNGYSFDHSSSFFVLDPERRLVADFATELTPQEIAVALRALITAPKPNEPR